ncbi:MAG: tetraacyldisaccharide 4'-kinase [Pseudomonadota bacterium]
MAHQRTTLETVLTRAWLRRGWLACVLWPASLLFGALAALRRTLYAAGVLRSVRLPVPVIVVGNVFIGGTGKTPLTIWLAGELKRAGYVPGIISRGYGTQQDAPRAVSANSLPQEVGDEPVLMASRTQCPVMVGRNRVDAARALLAANPAVNVIISDDGLQHYAMQRDVEIILFDARGAGNGWVLPAGPLREPASRRRDFTVVNAARIPAGMPGDTVRMQLDGDSAEQLAQRSQRMRLASLTQHKPVPRIVAAAGIGHPARFFSMLQAAGLTFDAVPLPDHYDFAVNPFAAMRADIILITEKDAVKCLQIEALKNDPRLWVVPVTAQLDRALAEKIVEKLRGYPTA